MSFQTQVLNQRNGMLVDEYFRNKNLSELTKEELAYLHLDIHHLRNVVKDFYIGSSLRELTQTLSASFGNVRTKQYVPLMICFAVLDQLGSLYSINSINCNYKNGIKKAFSMFTQVQNRSEIESLLTLRNGMLHDGSLVSHNKYTDTGVIYRMVVNSGKLITPPNKKWDGLYRDSLTDYITLIDLKELQRTVLAAIQVCSDNLKSSNLTITCSSEKEFFFKYLFSQEIEKES
jgi:hypothetical protein